jgi:hypothetical protein
MEELEDMEDLPVGDKRDHLATCFDRSWTGPRNELLGFDTEPDSEQEVR